jgi:hypothetical protein
MHLRAQFIFRPLLSGDIRPYNQHLAHFAVRKLDPVDIHSQGPGTTLHLKSDIIERKPLSGLHDLAYRGLDAFRLPVNPTVG